MKTKALSQYGKTYFLFKGYTLFNIKVLPLSSQTNFLSFKNTTMSKFTISLMGLVTLFSSCFGQSNFKTVDVETFEKCIADKGVQTVDVRTADEYREGHIDVKGVVNIDFKQADFMQQAEQRLDKSRTVAVYCRSGRRSADAANLLSKAGYKVVDLKGGIIEWQEKGRKITDR